MKIYVANYESGFFISDYENCVEHARYELDWVPNGSISVYCIELGKGQMYLVANVVAGGVKKVVPSAADFDDCPF